MSNLSPGELINQFGPKPSKEPALVVGSSTATVAGLISLIVFFAPDLLTQQQIVGISVAAAFVLPIITAVLTRRKVWSPDSVQKLVEEAIDSAIEAKNQVPKPLLKNPRPMTTEEEANLRTGFNRDK
jgi:hypothetical protein